MGTKLDAVRVLNAHRDLLCARVTARVHEPHLHDTYTIGLMHEGSLNYAVRGKFYAATPGDVFFINPYEIHFGGNAENQIVYDVIYPSRSMMKEILNPALQDDVFLRITQPCHRRSTDTRALVSAYAAAVKSDDDDERFERISAALKKSLCGVRVETMADPASARAMTDIVDRACEIMSREYASNALLTDLPERLGVSKYHFIRLFGRLTGFSPGRFLLQIRLAKARGLIIAGTALSQAAALAGFVDQSHMTRRFKEVYGFTPGVLSKKASVEGALIK